MAASLRRPPGLLHLGHASTFLIADARAREADGTLVLRNEDLDTQRSRPEFYRAMLEDLHWLGIRWQEGPDVGGPTGHTRRASAATNTSPRGARFAIAIHLSVQVFAQGSRPGSQRAAGN